MNLFEIMYADLKAMLPQLQEAIKSGIPYITELGHRIIQWNIFDLLLGIIFFGGLSLLFALMTKRLMKEKHENIFILGFSFIFSFIFAFIVFHNISLIVADILVPELRIIEILQHFLT